MIKNKLKAMFIHLVLSAIVISAFIALIIIFWFPEPFLSVTNFKEIAFILIAIDLVLGPLLTFVVFNPSKKSLRSDLSVIASIQVLGLSYGLYMLYLTHPVYITYFDNGFNLITAKNATPEKAKYEDLKISKFSSPKLAFMEVDNSETTNQLFSEMVDGSTEIEARSEFYKPYDKNLDKIISNALDPEIIFSEANMNSEKISFLDKNENISNFAFLPLTGPSKNAIIVLDKTSGEAVTAIRTNPWKYVKK